MAPDSPPTTAPPSAGAPEANRDKLRIRFRKGGDLRLLSHHDLMRCFERMLRRAALPFRSTQGYHPKPRLIFALSLPLGVVGCEEVVELELEEVLSLEEVRDRLVRQAPPGLEVLGLRRVGPRDGAQVRSLCYRVAVPPERVAALRERMAAVLAAADCWVERTRPEPRRVNLRPFLRDLRLVEPPAGAATPHYALEMDLWLTPGGTARPEEALTVLGLHDLLDAGAVIERARLELVDETPPPHAEGIA
jgi:radical SAM-linked protein